MADQPYAYVQDVPIDGDVYHQIVDRIGDRPLDGCLLHLCVRRADGGLRYLDIWESEQACARAFAERIHPAVRSVFKEIGFQPAGEPATERFELLDATGSMLVAGSTVSSRFTSATHPLAPGTTPRSKQVSPSCALP